MNHYIIVEVCLGHMNKLSNMNKDSQRGSEENFNFNPFTATNKLKKKSANCSILLHNATVPKMCSKTLSFFTKFWAILILAMLYNHLGDLQETLT